jgi:alpha-ketoglutarate-dependent taurine dioxygenase
MPMKITPNEGMLGARIEGVDLAQPLSRTDFATILTALGRYAVLCFPKQKLDARSLKAFSEQFGSLQGIAHRHLLRARRSRSNAAVEYRRERQADRPR